MNSLYLIECGDNREVYVDGKNAISCLVALGVIHDGASLYKDGLRLLDCTPQGKLVSVMD